VVVLVRLKLSYCINYNSFSLALALTSTLTLAIACLCSCFSFFFSSLAKSLRCIEVVIFSSSFGSIFIKVYFMKVKKPLHSLSFEMWYNFFQTTTFGSWKRECSDVNFFACANKKDVEILYGNIKILNI